jgi:hypothetical protein
MSVACFAGLANASWSLEELDLSYNDFSVTSLAALLAAPTFAIRRLNVSGCGLDAAFLVGLANAPWPLEELYVAENDMSAASAGPALTALSRRCPGLRVLDVSYCSLCASSFSALVEATWPALNSLTADFNEVDFLAGSFLSIHENPEELAFGDDAFAGFSELEELYLRDVPLDAYGAELLAWRHWPRLRTLRLRNARLEDDGAAELACGYWPALERLDLIDNAISTPPTLEEVRAWAPALARLRTGEICVNSGDVVRYGTYGAHGCQGFDRDASSDESRGTEADVEISEEEWSE